METDERRQKPNKIKQVFLSPLIGIHRFLGKIIGSEAQTAEDAILSIVDERRERGQIEDTGAEIITNAFEFDDMEVCDAMTHRVNVIAVNSGAALDDIIYIALEQGFSRLPVYGENLDDITGIIVVKDLLSLVGKTDLSDFSIDKFLREAVFVPESGSCAKLFKTLREEKAGMAVVVDEYGGTAGIITVEDLIEKVMGSIQDEYDNDDDDETTRIKKMGYEKYSINGETDPDDVLKLFGYELPENHEYETIAGFVTDLLGYIPEQETLETEQPHADYKDLRFVAVDMEDNCISRVIVFRNRSQEKSDEKARKEKA